MNRSHKPGRIFYSFPDFKGLEEMAFYIAAPPEIAEDLIKTFEWLDKELMKMAGFSLEPYPPRAARALRPLGRFFS